MLDYASIVLFLHRLPYRMSVLKTKKYDYRVNSVALNSASLLHLLSPRTVVHSCLFYNDEGGDIRENLKRKMGYAYEKKYKEK